MALFSDLSAALGGSGTSSRTRTRTSDRPTPRETPVDPPAKTPAGTPDPARSKVVGIPSPGGSVFARCRGGQAYLTSWSPRTGFETEEVERGPDSRTSVRFEADDREVKVIVRCSGGRPVSEIESKND